MAEKLDSIKEFGTTGLQFSGGGTSQLYEEWDIDLRGQNGARKFREMWDNNATVNAMVRAVMLLARGVDWRIDSGGDSPEDEKAQLLIETSLHDMSMSWEDTVCEIMSMVVFGYSYHEIVYKLRKGKTRDPGKSSQYTDGMVGWRKWPIRSQDSLWEWQINDDDGGIEGFWQTAPPKYQNVLIPIGKALLFRPETFKNNPEGRSPLRGAWSSYYWANNTEKLEAIGIERDLAGIPFLKCPGDQIANNTDAFQAMKEAGENIRQNEMACIVLPSDVDENGNPYYSFELVASPGKKQIDTNVVVARHNRAIARTLLADFLFIGESSVGSHSLVSSRTSMFANALGAYLDSLAGVVNRHAIPRLLEINNINVEQIPTLEHGDIESVDPEIYAKALLSLSQAGFNLAGDPEIENVIRTNMALPELTDDAIEMMEEDREAARVQPTAVPPPVEEEKEPELDAASRHVTVFDDTKEA